MLNITIRKMQIKTTMELSPQTSQYGHRQKVSKKKKQMLERVQRKGNPPTLSVSINWYNHYGK